jgi:ATP-dependent Lon protease
MSKHPSNQYPVLALRTEVQLPGSTTAVEVGRDISVKAVDAAVKDDNLLFVIPQRSPDKRHPAPTDLLEIGVLAEVVQVVKHAPSRYSVTLRFRERMRVDSWVATEPYLVAETSALTPVDPVDNEALAAVLDEVRGNLAEVAAEGAEDPERTRTTILGLDDADALVDRASVYLPLERDHLLALLLETDPLLRLRIVQPLIQRKAEVLKLKADIGAELEGESAKSHREKVLRDRMRSIQSELGETDESAELDEYRDKIAASRMPDEVRAVARRQIARMSQMQSASPEYTVARTYLENLLELPWGIMTEDRLDVGAARAILEADHAGLEKVKKRILEFIAVRTLAPDKHGPILCLVGPPGVGKTSLGRSIAAALGRKYVRAALGGVRDESEIRGHRRTYIGALPGRIASSLKKAGAMNPVFVLDEIDKLAHDVRGDPASALLEVLDPEQNKDFVDHYLEVALDLSKVMFIATANQLDTIPAPLLDRMEVIELPGYTSEEKGEIARRHLLPRQMAEHGLAKEQVEVADDAIDGLIASYTREAGVRNLEREIAALCRSAAVKIAGRESSHVRITAAELEELLGPARFHSEVASREPEVGVSTGLAWTPVGGDILFIEVRLMPGKGDLKLTGQVGDVMRESVMTALSWTKANADKLGVDLDKLQNHDLHVHLPQGGIKKDGPSAGVALAAALVSAFTGRPVRSDVAITGEINLRGRAMPVGGIKEKVIAAHRAGIKVVFLPEHNFKDAAEIPAQVLRELDIRFMKRASEALEVALAPAASKPDAPIPPVPPPVGSGSRTSTGGILPS